ncbi:hypothetical protein KVT40_003845 [Elsinoe batatas]|uniref:Uncharacterized protein n=1 Tax=Elsinoe batatas TaxID=2601811 RepID=A0A8K0L2S3_9PEZI|nr:hypothetical protein KVT40_003845 [Elsinoe batatas]
MHHTIRTDDGSASQRHLAIGLGAGLGGLFVLLLFGIILWVCIRRRKFRDSIIELESNGHGRQSTFDHPNAVHRMSSFLRSGPNNAVTTTLVAPEQARTAPEKMHRSVSARLSKSLHTTPQTQFEIEIGNHGKFRTFRLKRMRSKDDCDERPCRRKLSKKNLKNVHRTDSTPARLLVEESDHTEWDGDMVRAESAYQDEPESQLLRCRSSPMSPDRYTRVVATRRRSASAILPRSFSSTIVQDLGTERPVLHNRSLSYGAGCIGPAPLGPLPPLPRIPNGRNRSSTVDRYHRSSSSPTKSITAVGEKLQSPRPASDAISVCSNLSKWCIPTHSTATQSDAHVAHSQSASVNTWRSSISPAGSQRRASRHSLLPSRQLGSVRVTKDTSTSIQSPRSIFRSAPGSIAKITPHCRLQTRVSFTGSPAQRRRASALQEVTGNAYGPNQDPQSAHESAGAPRSTSSSPTRKRSALRSPDSPRRGHRRQNCVRISTLPPEVLGEGVSANSLLDGIWEESPDNLNHARVPVMRISAPTEQTSFRPVLSPRCHTDPVKWRASLTPSSPTLSMSRFEHDTWTQRHSRSFTGRGAFVEIERVHSTDMLSIPSLPSFGSRLGGIDERTPTPTIELTRPSGEYDDCRAGFPFELDFDVVPLRAQLFDDSDMSWSPPPADYFEDEKNISPPVWTDDDWPQSALRMTNVTVTASTSSSSLDFPFVDGGDPMICSDPLDAQSHLRLVNTDLPSFGRRRRRRRRVSPNSTPWATSLPPDTTTFSPLGAHPPTKLPSQPQLPESTTPLLESHSASSLPSHPSPLRPSSQNIPSPLRPISSHSRSILTERISGPRTAPVKGLRRSIMQLRRMNSSVQGEGYSTPQSRRYMKLGREASPILPFTFGGFPVFDDADGESLLSDRDAGEMDEEEEEEGSEGADAWVDQGKVGGEGEKALFEVAEEEEDKENILCPSSSSSPSPSQSRSRSQGQIQTRLYSFDTKHSRPQSRSKAASHMLIDKSGNTWTGGASFDFSFEFPCPSTLGGAAGDILRELENETAQAAAVFSSVERGDGVRRGSSVWEDGERAWDTCLGGQEATHVGTGMSLREMKELMGVEPNTPLSLGKKGWVGTPGSLYDREGFLNERMK